MALLLFMTLAAWAMGSAVGSSPDEDWVLTNVWCATTIETPYCDRSNSRHLDLEEQEPVIRLPQMIAEPHFCYVSTGQDTSAGCQVELRDKEVEVTRASFTLQPRRYFDIARKFVSQFIEPSVVKMRLFNSFLAATLIFLALLLHPRRSSDMLLTWLAVFAPVTAYFIASVNTSSWAIISTTTFVFGMISAVQNRKNLKVFAPSILLTVFSLWFANSARPESRYFLLPLALAIICYEFAPKKFKLNKNILAIAIALPVSLFFVFTSSSKYLGGTINILNDPRVEVTESATTTASNLLLQNFLNLPRFIMGFFGGWGLGWFEVDVTQTVSLLTLETFLLTTVFALRKSSKIHRTIFGGMFALMCSSILYSNQQTFTPIGQVIQPRYFLPFFLGLVIIAATYKTVRYPNSLVITVAILATISNSIALRNTIRRYTTGQDVPISKSLNNPIEWWWQFGPEPETVWLTGTLAFAALWVILIYERREEAVDAPKSPAPELAN